MGIYIYMDIAPERIDATKWKKTFWDAMKISKAGKLSHVTFKKVDGIEYCCNSISQNDVYRDEYGQEEKYWCVIGDLITGINIEDFVLYEDLNYYREENKTYKETNADVLNILLNRPEKYGLERPYMEYVWGNKTQGERAHMWLLAIACLINDRFPEASVIQGNITYGQCVRAVEMANQHLEEKIQLPVRCDKVRLLSRVKKMVGKKDKDVMALFDELYMGLRDDEYNRFLRDNFSVNTLYEYYRDEAKDLPVNKIMKKCLESGMEFESLCRMLVVDEAGPMVGIENFIEEIIDANLHIKEKETWDFTEFNRPDCEVPDDVEMQFARTFAIMLGAENKNINVYIPLNNLKEICKNVFDKKMDVDMIFEEKLQKAETDENKKSLNKLYSSEFMEEEMIMEESRAKYDIEEVEQFYYWNNPKDTIIPVWDQNMLKFISKIHEFGKKRLNKILLLDRHNRLEYMVELCRDEIIMPDSTWDKIIANIMDDDFILRYLSLYSVDINRGNTYKIVSVFATNYELFEYYWNRYMESTK